jgi:hypothetical protein
MSEGLRPMANDDLAAQLADLATALAFPPTPDLAGAVGSRLRASAAAIGSGVVGSGARPRPIRRSLVRSLLLAAGLALLIVGGALAVRFGLDLLSIEFGPLPSVAPASPTAPATRAIGAGLGLGQAVTLEEAGAAAAFDIRTVPALGPPDAVYLGDVSLRGQVAFVYAPGDGLPASDLLGGAGLLFTQNRGEADVGLARKLADNNLASVEPVDVDGAPGAWISGLPHFFWYLAPDGMAIEESRRLVGDTLVWERDGILYRLEGAFTRDYALELARSIR